MGVQRSTLGGNAIPGYQSGLPLYLEGNGESDSSDCWRKVLDGPHGSGHVRYVDWDTVHGDVPDVA